MVNDTKLQQSFVAHSRSSNTGELLERPINIGKNVSAAELGRAIRQVVKEKDMYATLSPWSCGPFDRGGSIVAMTLLRFVERGELVVLMGKRRNAPEGTRVQP